MNINNTFKPGDVVQLKSGGIKMTVSEILGTENDLKLKCLGTEYGQMFDGIRPQTIEERAFFPHVLRNVDEKASEYK